MLGGNAGRGDDVLLTRFDAAALVPVLTGRQRLLVHVERASDILQVLGLRREFPNLRLVLVGATEGWTVAEQIREAGVPVIANALVNLPASFEQLAATQSNIGRMRAAGVNVAMGTINEDETRMVQLSRQNAGNLVALTRVPGATGLSWGEALASVTSRPAEVMGLGAEIGSLQPGRRADVVVWSGDPLETTSTAQLVMIDGVQQPLDTRQSKLRDRYLRAGEQGMPKAYER
jgi:imidazolonepropionase-like amidohydrolase